jgi:hypothetical protein
MRRFDQFAPACTRTNTERFPLRARSRASTSRGRRLSPYLLTTVIESESSILQYRIFHTEPNAFRIDVIVRSAGQSASWQRQVCAELGRVIGEPADRRACQ